MAKSKYRVEEWFGEWAVIKGDTVLVDDFESRDEAEKYIAELESEEAA